MATKPRVDERDVTFKDTSSHAQVFTRFLPGFVVLMIWLYVVSYDHEALGPGEPHLGQLWNELYVYRYMTIAMVFGSLVAGSTPLGGGVVGFPVAVLALKFTTAQSRDFSILIQSVGMNAAGYILILFRPHLLNFNFIACFIGIGTPGVLAGLAIELNPFATTVTFQILVIEFAFVLFYLECSTPALPSELVPHGEGHERIAYVLMAAFAFMGGFFTANVGSGSDICLYAFGLIGWNSLVPARPLSDNQLTACSVVTMGALSLVAANLPLVESLCT